MKNKIIVLPFLFILLVFGCKNSLMQIEDTTSSKYGSLTIGDTTESRALKIEKIKGAKVSVSGNGFDELSATTEIKEGTMTGVTIDKIPVGKNRIVTVHASSKETETEIEDNLMSGVIMRAVTDINSGFNSVDVNWTTTALGNVFYELSVLGYNISEITAEQKDTLEKAIPPSTSVHATLVNANAIANDFKNKCLKDSSEYALTGGTVTFDVEGNEYDNYFVQVTDPASKKLIPLSERQVTGITPGTWDLVVWSDNFEWFRESEITVTGEVFDYGTLRFVTPKPNITPASCSFSDSLVISIEAEKGATVYYTIDGKDPSLNSSVYTGPFTINENATVKAFAVINDLVPSVVVSEVFVKEEPEFIPSSKSGVMLQGFNWESASRSTTTKQNKWYGIMQKQASEIKGKFAYVWMPPPSMSASFGPEGYLPTQLNDLNSLYGTETELKNFISSISPTKAIADVVVNHRCGSANWGTFTNPSWDADYKSIASDDEGFSDSTSDMYGSSNKGAKDTGEGYSAARDLDHTNPKVQQGIIDWMNNILKPAGFVGWRYDYVKGFGGEYVGKYNAGSEAEFSVGEYWPTNGYNSGNPSAWGSEIKSWISSTEKNGGQKSKAFDFALKGAMNTVFGNKGSNISNSNYSLLAHSSNLMISQPEDAVTFIDNHDTGSSQAHWYLDPADVGTAYAFILTHPGYPCVAWQHYFTDAQSGGYGDSQYIGGKTVPGTSNTYRQHIDYLIDLRNDVGIEYDDKVSTSGTSSSCYVGEIIGNNGSLLVMIGNVTTPTREEYKGKQPIYSGTNFAIYRGNATELPEDDNSSDEVTLSASKDVGYGNAVYFTGSFNEGNSWNTAIRGSCTNNVWTVNVTGSSFEWKALIGSYEWGESVTVKNYSNWSWEADPNNSYPSTTTSKLK